MSSWVMKHVTHQWSVRAGVCLGSTWCWWVYSVFWNRIWFIITLKFLLCVLGEICEIHLHFVSVRACVWQIKINVDSFLVCISSFPRRCIPNPKFMHFCTYSMWCIFVHYLLSFKAFFPVQLNHKHIRSMIQNRQSANFKGKIFGKKLTTAY